MRFGDLKRGFTHPVDIFLSLAKDASIFEASSFGMRFGKVSDEDGDAKYFAHLDVTDQRQVDSLALYHQQADENVNRAVNEALKISRKIAEHVKEKFEAVGAPVDEEQISASYLDDFLRAFGMSVYDQFPAVNTEEFFLRFIFDENIHAVFSHFVVDAAGDIDVQEIGGNMLNGNEAKVLSGLLHRFESLALYDPLGNAPLPYCCDVHPSPGNISVFIECEQEGSLNAVIREMCGRELHELLNMEQMK